MDRFKKRALSLVLENPIAKHCDLGEPPREPRKLFDRSLFERPFYLLNFNPSFRRLMVKNVFDGITPGNPIDRSLAVALLTNPLRAPFSHLSLSSDVLEVAVAEDFVFEVAGGRSLETFALQSGRWPRRLSLLQEPCQVRALCGFVFTVLTGSFYWDGPPIGRRKV